MSIRVLIADDHPVVIAGLRATIEKKAEDIKIIAEASTGKEVLEIAKKYPADVYILDISMPVLNGIETASRLKKSNPRSNIIILSIHNSSAFVEKAFESGVKGYILKESATEDIVYAIRQVYLGKYFLSPGISKIMVNGFLGRIKDRDRTKTVAIITKKEMDILQLLGEGSTTKEIAQQLNISLNTVKVHRKNIMQKLDIHESAKLIRYAIKEGISKL
jgi:DNA-binding NarL/FixJ family response regulator